MEKIKEIINVEKNLEKSILEILDMNIIYDDKLYFEKLENDYSCYEILINNYMTKIKNIDIDYFFSDNYRKYNEVLEYFDPICKTKDEFNLFNVIDGDAECIVDNLVNKILENYIELPINVMDLIKYSFSSNVEPNDYYYLFKRIIIRLSILCLIYKNYN